ncbi:MqnA/MqnD/SBP family protein [Nitrosophilus kaiyonis]|uniref:MqnA/MqnD/SBP family protein n=1 Tax=Nitrosophilus kaiyonis TaxID=2930200 RepID=UPI002492A682|nr:MqnA/MqnD/SBP family protein [Nitrosophilus kaiyonis]
MIFAKIDYINLLPFYVFLKRYLKNPSDRAALFHKKGVPSKINQDFKNNRVDAAFISSIYSYNQKCTNLGIVAKKEVLSVIVCNGKEKDDIESNTSNVLAKILNLKGEVLIGDKALKRRKIDNSCVDLAKEWYKKYKLPFVFARLCYKKNPKINKKIEKKFLNSHLKIPQYILKKYVKRSSLSQKEILHYLSLIEYKIDKKAEKSLKKFIYLSRRVKTN